jgi:predicted MFS family arabinose efflux permease
MLTALRTVALPLAVTLAVQAVMSLAALAVPVAAPRMAADLGVPPSFAGHYVALLYLGAVGATLAARRLIGGLGPMGASLLALGLAASGLALLPQGPLPVLAIGTLVMGLGYGLTTPASSEILHARTPRGARAFVFSLKQTGVPLGGVVAGVVVPPLLGALGWRATLTVVAGLCLVMALAFAPLRQGLDGLPRHDPVGRRRSPLRLVLADRRLSRLAVASFGFSAMQLCLVTFLVAYLVGEVGLSLVTAGLLFALTQTAGIAGRIAWGWIADRLLAPRTTLVLMAATMALCSALTALVGPGWPIAPLALLLIAFGGSAIAWNGVFLAEVARLAPDGEAAAATGGALTFTYAGVVAGPPLFALVVELAGGYGAAYLSAALLALVSLWLVARA